MKTITFRSALCFLLLSLPPGSALHAQEELSELQQTLEQARTEAGYMQLEKALQLYSDVIQDAQVGSDEWVEANYGAATCLNHITPYEPERIRLAVNHYKQILEAAPNSKYAPRAMMNLGRIEELSDWYGDKIDLPKAREWYQKVRDGWPDDPIASEATLRVAGTHIQTFEKDQVQKGVQILEEWLASHPDDALASAMWQYLADTYFYPLEDFGKSVQAYQKVDELGWMDSSIRGRMYWRTAVMADRHLNDRATAARFYRKIITDAPTSGKAYEAQERLRAMGEKDVPEIDLRGQATAAAKATAEQQEQSDE